MKEHLSEVQGGYCRNRPSALPQYCAQAQKQAAERESAEYNSNRQVMLCAKALDSGIDSACLPVGAGGAVYVGAGSPLNYACGLPLDEASDEGMLSPAAIVAAVSQFYAQRQEPARIAVSSLSSLATFELLAARGFSPIHAVEVWCKALNTFIPGPVLIPGRQFETVPHENARIWADTVLQGFLPEGPVDPYESALLQACASAEHATLLIVNDSTTPCAAAAMTVHSQVATLFSAATLLPYRQQGLQTALMAARLQMAQHQCHCRWAVVSSEPQSPSARNAERMGFIRFYSQILWQQR